MNWPTGIITILIAAVFFAVMRKLIRDHKSGKSSCACGGDCKTCGHCSGANRQ